MKRTTGDSRPLLCHRTVPAGCQPTGGGGTLLPGIGTGVRLPVAGGAGFGSLPPDELGAGMTVQPDEPSNGIPPNVGPPQFPEAQPPETGIPLIPDIPPAQPAQPVEGIEAPDDS